MATIYNSNLTKELIDAARIQTSRDKVPSEIAEKVVPVMEVNPKLLRNVTYCKFATSTITGTSTIFTADTNKDTYITAAVLSMSDDVASDNIQCYITVVINGEIVRINNMLKTTLTITAKDQVMNYIVPIKVDRGSNISMVNSFTVGASRKSSVIIGYTVDNPYA